MVRAISIVPNCTKPRSTCLLQLNSAVHIRVSFRQFHYVVKSMVCIRVIYNVRFPNHSQLYRNDSCELE